MEAGKLGRAPPLPSVKYGVNTLVEAKVSVAGDLR